MTLAAQIMNRATKEKFREAERRNAETLARDGGVLIASFPRSGSTMTVSLFAELAATLRHPDDAGAHQAYRTRQVADVIRNLHADWEGWSSAASPLPKIARTHEVAPVGVCRTIFWYRNPADAIYSYFLQSKRVPGRDSVEDFTNTVVDRWNRLAEAALGKASVSNDILILRYEDYLGQPEEIFGRMVRFLSAPGGELVSSVVSNVNRRFTTGRDFAPTPDQPQRGTVGANAARLSPEVRSSILDRTATLKRALDARCVPSDQP